MYTNDVKVHARVDKDNGILLLQDNLHTFLEVSAT